MIDDYADTVIDNSDLGRDRAPVLRWAIALDDGRLVFAAEDVPELTRTFPPHRRITGRGCGAGRVSVRKDAAHKFSGCGVERIDDVGFDAPTWRNIETVLTGPLPDRVQLLR